jgi:propanol-preferring alcohol dehydrogenase
MVVIRNSAPQIPDTAFRLMKLLRPPAWRLCFVPGSSAIVHCALPATPSGLASMASVRQHLITQVAIFEERTVYAFTRPGDVMAQIMARELGCEWTSGSDDRPPEMLDAAIIFAPVGSLVPAALKAVGKGGTVVCGGIHMSTIPAFEYELLWGERVLCSVANLTRQDATEFLELARTIPVVAQTTIFPLHEANEALDRLRAGNITGTAVLVP